MTRRRRPSSYRDDFSDGKKRGKSKPITAFKDFDYSEYDKQTIKKAEGKLSKAIKAIKRASTSKEVQWVAGIVITAYLMMGKDKSDEMYSVLRDIMNGRFDIDSLVSVKNIIVDIIRTLSTKK